MSDHAHEEVDLERLKWCENMCMHEPHRWFENYGMVTIARDCPGNPEDVRQD